MAERKKRALVAGGAGFIGLNLVKRLLKDGYEVLCVDISLKESIPDMEPLLHDKNFTYIIHDIIEPLEIKGPLDEIYNLATTAAPKYYQADRVHTLKTCVFGSTNLLDLATEKKARILQTSTSEIYGDPLEHPQREEYRGNVNPIGPRACYDEGKRAAEALFMDYHRHHGTDVKIVRIFNCYGPHMKDDGRIMVNFIKQTLHGERITLYGDGTQTRSFMYIDDLIDGIMKMMQTSDFTGPVNIGNPEEHTVKEIAEIIIKLTGAKSEIIYQPLPQDDPTKRKPHIGLAKKKLGWKPKTPLQAGLKKTIAFYRANEKKLSPSASPLRIFKKQPHSHKKRTIKTRA